VRVLLSAYACEPDKGSEPEVGWQRALHMLAHADEVWVLTRGNNKTVIEADSLSYAHGLHFIYYDLPAWALRIKKQSWFHFFYFVFWQWGAYRLAARHHREKPFDCVYHVTFASMQFGSFMGQLGIPFVIGPIAGGERAPFRLRRSMSMRGKASELLRDFKIVLQRLSPLARRAYAAAKHIYVTTPESLRLVPSKWRMKTTVHLAIAAPDCGAHHDGWRPPESPRFVFAGRLVHLKGAHFAIRALAEVRREVPSASLTLIGVGPDEQRLHELARLLGVADAVEFSGHLPHQSIASALHGYTALVFPSLHDSGGFVVLEALAEGLPAICLDLGGPGVIVNGTCGIIVPTARADEAQIVTRIAEAMISLGSVSDTEFSRLSKGAIARANELSWAELTRIVTSC
jgi:glycosyltransferase involved in cell wall biosynthesis